MFETEKKSSLERLKKGLYSRTSRFVDAPRHDIHGIDSKEVRHDWQGPAAEASVTPAADAAFTGGMVPRAPRKGYKVFLLSAAGFLLLTLAVGAYTLFGGKNFVSVDNVDILIDGPVSVAGGERLSLNASVVNKNATPIELVDLIAEFPDGTKDPTDPTKDLSRQRISLGNITSGQVVQRQLEALMFGEEGDSREVKFTIEYRTANSNAIFYKEKSYNLTLSSSPVFVSVDSLDKVLSGQQTKVTITVASNTTSPVQDLLLVLDYPAGFSISGSNPVPTFGDNMWRIGDLAPGAKRTITFNAIIAGEDDEQKVLHANVGIRDAANERQIATNIISREHDFTIEKPFLGLALSFDGNTGGDLAITPGDSVRADLVWTNNSATRITNAKIEAKLSGNALDRKSISVTDGYYDSSRDTIVWEAGRTAGLDSIAPGESNRVSFSFASISGQAMANPSITVSASASGSRVDESGVAQDVETAVVKTAKVISNLSLSSRALHSQGPIVNGGPVPPKVDQGTTYTVAWTVSNTSNSVNGVQVMATIPPYVSWTGVTSPTDANITYDSVGGHIIWQAGDIQPGTASAVKQVYFQLSLKPNANQVGDAPEIMGQSTITGKDAFTGATIQNSAPGISTRTTTDFYWKQGDDIVVQ